MEQPCANCRVIATPCQYGFAPDYQVLELEALPTPTSRVNDSANLDTIDDLSYSTFRSTPPLQDALDEFDQVSAFQEFLQPQFPEVFVPRIEDETMDWIDLLNAEGTAEPAQLNPDNPAGKIRRFKFLYNFTGKTGLAATFDCGNLAQRENVLASWQEEILSKAQSPITSFESQPCFSGLLDPLVIKLHQLVHRLKEVVTMKPRNSVIALSWTAELEQQCLDFFSPSNVRRCLMAYWAIWHPNVNFVHKPSFDPKKSNLTLLAAMVLIGACVSPAPKCGTQARLWFDCVEEMVFSDDHFCSDFFSFSGREATSQEVQKAKIQAVQAAYMVCLYQNWDGSDASRRRIRRYRFSTLVSVVRDLNLDRIQDTTYDEVPDHDFNWAEFIAREELTRTLLWIFLLDTCFVIFNNLPPRMVIKEMQMRMAYPEACFQAATAPECAAETHSWMSMSTSVCKLSVREAVEAFCAESLSARKCADFANLGPLNLFVITSAFHILIFQHMNSFSDIGQMTAMDNALRNWQDVWNDYCRDLANQPPHVMVDGDDPKLATEDMWRRVGFMQHADEFRLLAVLLKERIMLKSVQQLPAFSAATENGDRGRIIDPVLNEYDQNSMRQINDLIASFENIQMQ
ncbi:zinc finger, C2H2 type domain-containing protein [Paraphoma chrysanthemicola]|uniref:Zinc finger, C2H2 type domain-containing protein n=1 Tax=Paraphoma chrysanthemicola TaxID=798071 RepID=A0A8K0RHR9_9PLEO|nr:zinc finger, C2H2 type domain-containing protein [Paraphoma chrysanthemicola]